MRIKRLFAVGLSAVLAMSTFGYNSWAADKNEKNSSAGSTTEYAGGYVASELDNNVPEYYSDIAMFADNTVPSVYPENMTEFKNKYPALRNQNPYGTCWAFSSMGLAEFDLINDGSKDSSVDLSELQLAYFTYNSVVDPLGGTSGDYDIYHNENASENYLNAGGNYEYAIRRLSQWVGAVNESDVPYTEAKDSITNGIDASHAYSGNVAHLQNAYRINIKTQPDEVKKAIMEHGAVGVMYTHHGLGENHVAMSYNDKKDTIISYNDGGHAVMVVGWDDDYSTDNFTDDNKPANKGAWLVRNSWGNDFGYFWMSYETCSLAEAAWVYDFNAEDGYDNNYQLDGGLETGIDNNYTQAANVFTVKEKTGVESETLKAVSLSFMKTANVNYTVEIYTDMTDKTNPESGTKSAGVSGSTTYAGYYTVPLDNEVVLKPGSTYAVVVKTDKKALEFEYTYSTSANPSDKNSPLVWERKVSDNYNVDKNSLYYGYGKYAVSPWGNWRIKAFTSDNLAKTDAGKVAEAKTVVEEAIKNIAGSNDITKADIQKVVDDALSKAGITEVKAVVGELNKTDATTQAAGNIKADITLTCGTAADKVELNKTINMLPKTDAQKVAEAKAIVEEAIKNITGSNDITKADIQHVVDEALSKAGITEVKATVGDLNKTDATTEAAGNVKADIAITCGTAADKVELNKTIDKLTAPDPEPTPGDTTFEPVVSEGVPSVKVDTDKDKLIDKTLDDNQKEIVNKGGSADIVLSIKNATDNNAADKKLIEASFKANEKIGKCLDISLLLTVKDKDGNVVNNNEKVSDSQEKITITINVPSDIISKNREYKIIRVHNGKVKTVDSVWNADNKTITFKTNEFSTYAIVYSDKTEQEVKPTDPETKPSAPETKPTDPETKPSEEVTKPSESVTNGTESSTQAGSEAVSEVQNTETGTSTQTGDATRLMMWIMLALLSGAGIAGIISKKKKFNN